MTPNAFEPRHLLDMEVEVNGDPEDISLWVVFYESNLSLGLLAYTDDGEPFCRVTTNLHHPVLAHRHIVAENMDEGRMPGFLLRALRDEGYVVPLHRHTTHRGRKFELWQLTQQTLNAVFDA